jgi:hypothetical protein
VKGHRIYEDIVKGHGIYEDIVKGQMLIRIISDQYVVAVLVKMKKNMKSRSLKNIA